MKKIISIFTLFLTFIILTSCQSTKIVKNNKITKTNIDKLLEYKDSYVGNNSAVAGIINNLPGNIYFKGMALKTDKTPYGIEITYGINPNLGKEDFNKYWSENRTKKIFLNNATALLILVKNADEIKFNLDKNSFTISRKELETFYGKDLKKYSEDKSLWKKEIIEGKLKQNN